MEIIMIATLGYPITGVLFFGLRALGHMETLRLSDGFSSFERELMDGPANWARRKVIVATALAFVPPLSLIAAALFFQLPSSSFAATWVAVTVAMVPSLYYNYTAYMKFKYIVRKKKTEQIGAAELERDMRIINDSISSM